MSPTRVAIIGCGIAGPVVAAALKLRGYDPVVYERHESSATAGLAIGIQHNGIIVLSKIPGLLEHVGGRPINEVQFYSTVDEDKGLLGATDQPRTSGGAEGLGLRTFERSVLQDRLASFASGAGVKVNWGHKLESIEQEENSVSVTFANGVQETFSFVVGCDGLHSQTRKCLFEESSVEYTGLSMWGGFSPMPPSYQEKNVVKDIYGNGAHGLLIPVSDSKITWALTQREPEARESWKAIDNATEEFKASSFGNWDFMVGDIIKSSTHVVKFGVYVRPELPSWHMGRVVLIGDAAHPFSPHVGQGACQAFEDVGLFVELLDKHNPGAMAPTTSTLDQIFTELKDSRAPRVRDLLSRAKAQGQARTVKGVEACIARNNLIRERCQNGTIAAARLGA